MNSRNILKLIEKNFMRINKNRKFFFSCVCIINFDLIYRKINKNVNLI